ncbi:hypothetical protein K466DRAFT_28497 [Polyporus arcularius HHB13444]|uniref:Uncharacterized protein n=1 Tax=Polyporus arcularius HHB13444 TaxID=1314778 RepID=A0A5C3NS94_9APHY|nr:hypothetical protein K466DRAFT_28497 [Polyporus arcularius HHB13444]
MQSQSPSPQRSRAQYPDTAQYGSHDVDRQRSSCVMAHSGWLLSLCARALCCSLCVLSCLCLDSPASAPETRFHSQTAVRDRRSHSSASAYYSVRLPSYRCPLPTRCCPGRPCDCSMHCLPARHRRPIVASVACRHSVRRSPSQHTSVHTRSWRRTALRLQACEPPDLHVPPC